MVLKHLFMPKIRILGFDFNELPSVNLKLLIVLIFLLNPTLSHNIYARFGGWIIQNPSKIDDIGKVYFDANDEQVKIEMKEKGVETRYALFDIKGALIKEGTFRGQVAFPVASSTYVVILQQNGKQDYKKIIVP